MTTGYEGYMVVIIVTIVAFLLSYDFFLAVLVGLITAGLISVSQWLSVNIVF